MSKRTIGLGALLTLMVALAAGASGQPRCPTEIPLYVLISGACPVAAPRCYAGQGVCRWPATVPAPHLGTTDAWSFVQPGMPCRCLAADGTWVPGVIR